MGDGEVTAAMCAVVCVRVECVSVVVRERELETAKSPRVRLAVAHSVASAPRLSWDLNKRGESPLLDKIEWIAQWLHPLSTWLRQIFFCSFKIVSKC